MCTLSWGPLPGGFFVAFNRDERRSRAAGLGPRVLERNGVQALMPIDGEAGGTWIAVNELGCAVALLNGYRFQAADARPADGPLPWISRGQLCMDVCDAGSVGEVAARLAARDLSRFRPFELVALDAEGAAAVHTWDGAELEQHTLGPADRPLVSSSFDDAGARLQRRALFAHTVGAAAGESDTLRFHASHEPRRGAYSPCMHREDAHTVSFTHLRASADAVELSYRPSAPCGTSESVRAQLPRRSIVRP